MSYDSVAVVESAIRDGVSFRVARMSFGRRVELMRRVREFWVARGGGLTRRRGDAEKSALRLVSLRLCVMGDLE
jgi:hypothetical protein